jgi:hypothetical protein
MIEAKNSLAKKPNPPDSADVDALAIVRSESSRPPEHKSDQWRA